MSFKVASPIMVCIPSILTLVEFAGNEILGGDDRSKEIFDTISKSADLISDDRNKTIADQRSHSDLRHCLAAV